MTGVASFMSQMEKEKPPKRKVGMTPSVAKKDKAKKKTKLNAELLKPLIEEYKSCQKECGGEFNNMNCYNTLFVGRLEHSTAERKLLREFEVFGPIKDLKLVFDKSKETTGNGNEGKTSKDKNYKVSKGYAFIEYEHEEDMKRAYRAADGMKIDGREIVVDVERGHTVPNWLPRRLGGGLGGTRIGGKKQNIAFPGRWNSKSRALPPPGQNPSLNMQNIPPLNNMRGGPPNPNYPPFNHGYGGHQHHHGGHAPPMPMPPMRGGPPMGGPHFNNAPPPHYDRNRGNNYYGGGGNRRSR